MFEEFSKYSRISNLKKIYKFWYAAKCKGVAPKSFWIQGFAPFSNNTFKISK